MTIKEFTYSIRHLETSHPLPEVTTVNEGDSIYQELAKKWFKELSSTDQKDFKLAHPLLEVYGATIY